MRPALRENFENDVGKAGGAQWRAGAAGQLEPVDDIPVDEFSTIPEILVKQNWQRQASGQSPEAATQ